MSKILRRLLKKKHDESMMFLCNWQVKVLFVPNKLTSYKNIKKLDVVEDNLWAVAKASFSTVVAVF